MNFIVWIIFGALAGWVASMIVKTNDQMGAIANIVVGIIGAFVGGLLANLVGSEGVTGFIFRSFIVAVIGAVVLLVIFKAVRKRAH